MAAGVIRSFLVQAPTPPYFPLMFQHSPCKADEDVEMLEAKLEGREDDEEREVEEEDEESEAQEEEEECLDEVFLNPATYALDVTKQLLRFADLISRDVQRYFGRCSDDQEACDIYSDSVSVTTSGRLRYYDDLLKIARAGSPGEQESSAATSAGDEGVAKGNSGLGPLAELFNHRGPTQARSRPMIKRHLPLSFWTEPIPCCSLVGFSNTPDVMHKNSDTPSQDSTHTDANTHMQYNVLPHHSTHALDSTQPDFSDLLANWDPNPELTHTLTENTHMQH
ncbi:protein PERCC1-like [Plectropomus leopardus]|uniref:protein PERCC1-like n=1 Tax=Plectropomus leopardus TaxID=160734 RepID=UPI001C4C458C|nr:protein PERCC1-like [Plectropomus leopardus]